MKEVFPQCRIFHDSMETLSEEKLKSEFVNWVRSLARVFGYWSDSLQIFLCSPSSEPMVMRPAVEDDFLQSFLRSRLLTTLSEREVSGQFITQGMDLSDNGKRKYIFTDEKNNLDDWQDKEALSHWGLMRKVLPDAYWETY